LHHVDKKAEKLHFEAEETDLDKEMTAKEGHEATVFVRARSRQGVDIILTPLLLHVIQSIFPAVYGVEVSSYLRRMISTYFPDTAQY
jgi:hypothetical protein